MKVITLWQPWASFISCGLKTIETRTHKRFRSLKGQRILIHAGKEFDNDWLNLVIQAYPGEIQIRTEGMPLGAIVASAFVKDFRLLFEKDNKAALIDCKNTIRYGLILEDIIRLENPIPAVGHRGIWDYEI